VRRPGQEKPIANTVDPHRSQGSAMSRVATILALLMISLATGAEAQSGKPLDKVTFATNWLAQAEHGGHYQAVADGTYAKYGLDVTITPGGPQKNNRLLMITGKAEFYMAANLIPSFTAVEEKVPVMVVASMFQKDPMVIMSHPGQGIDKWDDLKSATIFLSQEAQASVFRWMKQQYGFKDEKVKPYTFNPAPFIADKKSAQQGYITSEPYEVERQGKFNPNLFLVADHGLDTYSTLIETRTDLVEKNPDLVRRFVEASLIGWANYIYGDNAKANALIKTSNPDMTDAQIAFSIAKMKEFGIVDSGDSIALGVGAMTDARMQSFYDKMVKAGVLKAGIDIKKAYTLQFVNKGAGNEIRPKK
jgi:NitT/TauT family transport system substrate-binding protein